MIKQDWMVIVAGEALVDAMTAETKARCKWTGAGYASEDLCVLQREQSARGILGAEIVTSNYGCSVRYDSGLQNFGLLAGLSIRSIWSQSPSRFDPKSGMLDGTLEHAERWVREWVAKDPTRRYAWRRKGKEEAEAALRERSL